MAVLYALHVYTTTWLFALTLWGNAYEFRAMLCVSPKKLFNCSESDLLLIASVD